MRERLLQTCSIAPGSMRSWGHVAQNGLVDWFGKKGLRDRRLLLPLGIGLASVVIILIAGRQVPWFLKIILALVAFLYMGLQSAFYLVPHEDEPGVPRKQEGTTSELSGNKRPAD
jgi:hypothetical protein